MLRWIQLSLVLEGMKGFPGRFAASFSHVLCSFQGFLTSWLLLCDRQPCAVRKIDAKIFLDFGSGLLL